MNKLVRVVNVSNNPLPEYKTEGAAGMDGYANIPKSVILNPQHSIIIPVGIKVQLPLGYELQVRPRSGLAAKNQITVLNSPGTIDSDFRGEICAILINHSNKYFEIKPGDRICQFVLSKYEKIEWVDDLDLDETDIGEKGFGSTGVKI